SVRKSRAARGTPVGSEARNRDCGKVGGANGSLGQFGHRRGAEFFVCARLGPARATAFAREASRSKSVTNAAIAGVYGRVGSCLCQGLPSLAIPCILTSVAILAPARDGKPWQRHEPTRPYTPAMAAFVTLLLRDASRANAVARAGPSRAQTKNSAPRR